MENNEKNNSTAFAESEGELTNRILRTTVYIILATFSFCFGYWIGTSALPEDSLAVNEAVMNTETDVMAEIWYEVCIEESALCLYRVGSAERVLLASEEISAELFPYEDKQELKSGLIFESFEAALSSFEDFVS